MAEITYVTGDATDPIAPGPRIIVHVCNDRGGWGAGFVLAISKRWKRPEAQYRKWAGEHGDALELGTVQVVQVDVNLWVANMVAQAGYRTKAEPVPLRYDALATCLGKVAGVALERGASIHMPRIGCGLAGGTWDRIEPLLEDAFVARDIDVTVYDWAQ